MEVTDRVHVVAHGWEVARIVDPLFELKADKVVLIGPLNDAWLAEFEEEMIADLESMDRLEFEMRRANLYDFDSAVQVFSQAVKDHEGDDVYINVSTGSSLAAIAGMIAAQTADATPFYVQPGFEDDASIPDEPVIPEAGKTTELPVFELEGPSTEQLRVLAHLHGRDSATKKELIQFAEDQELPFIANTEAKSDEGRYRLLESHIIDPLTEGDYVSVEKVGRKKEVCIEQRGVDALAAFPLDAETLETVEQDAVYGPPNFPRLPTRETTSSYQRAGNSEKE
ncbi:DUF6293 family protein [Haloarcula salinisoli]|uniref:Uncharacterized protein n=1 Tax=Haloarcula salinisoli TaxID=2487746 RepID=A0A8J7YI03_9EURY|nr:DUF6293 family protein [Halomicroarcula salinisoli]MBX0286256.1 hypothetical protein [Halomicroarcula salinisoli]MBX0302256.1 hypothetical protein [Halomicroarcula salinisoli]